MLTNIALIEKVPNNKTLDLKFPVLYLLEKYSLDSQFGKVSEELDELKSAVENHEQIENIWEEYFDVLQTIIGLLQFLPIRYDNQESPELEISCKSRHLSLDLSHNENTISKLKFSTLYLKVSKDLDTLKSSVETKEKITTIWKQYFNMTKSALELFKALPITSENPKQFILDVSEAHYNKLNNRVNRRDAESINRKRGMQIVGDFDLIIDN